MSRLWIVAYDIADPRRLRQLARLMENVGQRVQHSIFACRLEYGEFLKLRHAVREIVNVANDEVRFYPLCAWCADRLPEKLDASAELPFWVV